MSQDDNSKESGILKVDNSKDKYKIFKILFLL